LSRLRRIKKGRGDIILAVVNVDLFNEGYDFVYGEAEVGSGAATLSISRLVNENINTTIDTNQAAERVIREAIHEAGHLYGLGHCPNPRCVMRTCTCLEEVDEATGRLCDYCKQQLVPNAPK
jgi:archaemetzincin